MKNCFIVTSSIQPSNYNFINEMGESVPRSFFNESERFIQTTYTIENLVHLNPNATIYLIDNSENYKNYINAFNHYGNVKYIALALEDRIKREASTTNTCKPLCETLVLRGFLAKYEREIRSYDFATKVTGRYVFSNFFPNDLKKNHIHFKKTLYHDHPNLSNYDKFKTSLTENMEPNEKLPYRTNLIYSFDTDLIEEVMYFNDMICTAYTQQENKTITMPYMMHYYTKYLDYKYTIEEEFWKVNGFDGLTGTWLRF